MLSFSVDIPATVVVDISESRQLTTFETICLALAHEDPDNSAYKTHDDLVFFPARKTFMKGCKIRFIQITEKKI